MKTGAVTAGLDRRRFLLRACGLLLGMLPGAPSLAAPRDFRSGQREAAFYRPLRLPPGAA